MAWKGRSPLDTGYFRSMREDDPWLKIHMHTLQMFGITIINNRNCCGESLKNLEIRAGYSSELDENPVVGTFKGPGWTGGEHYIPFGKRVTVEYISGREALLQQPQHKTQPTLPEILGTHVIAFGSHAYSAQHD